MRVDRDLLETRPVRHRSIALSLGNVHPPGQLGQLAIERVLPRLLLAQAAAGQRVRGAVALEVFLEHPQALLRLEVALLERVPLEADVVALALETLDRCLAALERELELLRPVLRLHGSSRQGRGGVALLQEEPRGGRQRVALVPELLHALPELLDLLGEVRRRQLDRATIHAHRAVILLEQRDLDVAVRQRALQSIGRRGTFVRLHLQPIEPVSDVVVGGPLALELLRQRPMTPLGALGPLGHLAHGLVELDEIRAQGLALEVRRVERRGEEDDPLLGALELLRVAEREILEPSVEEGDPRLRVAELVAEGVAHQELALELAPELVELLLLRRRGPLEVRDPAPRFAELGSIRVALAGHRARPLEVHLQLAGPRLEQGHVAGALAVQLAERHQLGLETQLLLLAIHERALQDRDLGVLDDGVVDVLVPEHLDPGLGRDPPGALLPEGFVEAGQARLEVGDALVLAGSLEDRRRGDRLRGRGALAAGHDRLPDLGESLPDGVEGAIALRDLLARGAEGGQQPGEIGLRALLDRLGHRLERDERELDQRAIGGVGGPARQRDHVARRRRARERRIQRNVCPRRVHALRVDRDADEGRLEVEARVGKGNPDRGLQLAGLDGQDLGILVDQLDQRPSAGRVAEDADPVRTEDAPQVGQEAAVVGQLPREVHHQDDLEGGVAEVESSRLHPQHVDGPPAKDGAIEARRIVRRPQDARGAGLGEPHQRADVDGADLEDAPLGERLLDQEIPGEELAPAHRGARPQIPRRARDQRGIGPSPILRTVHGGGAIDQRLARRSSPHSFA